MRTPTGTNQTWRAAGTVSTPQFSSFAAWEEPELFSEEIRPSGHSGRCPLEGILMSASSTPQGPGSVSGAPNVPAGFTDTFTSCYVDAGQLRLHAVTGGEGPPLLLVHGWPQTWYAWRMLMPTLARDFSVVAVDQRGIGLSDKPEDGYDTGTLAGDL